MSALGIIGGSFRGLLIAAATAAAAFGLLVVLHPFSTTSPGALTVATTAPGAEQLHQKIEALWGELALTQASLDAANAAPISTGPRADAATRAQYEAQIAAATERRDLSNRHAAAIRQGLEAGIAVSSLADIRDSVVVGQLIAQQTALESQIAEQGARFKSSHPVMRALIAQRAGLAEQIRQAAASIATALESEAKLDDAQIALLQGQLTPVDLGLSTTRPVDTAALNAKAGTLRAELDGLVDAYFNLKPTTATATTSLPAATSPLSPINLLITAIGAGAALVFQIYLGLRRRKTRSGERDLQDWATDGDPEIVVSEPRFAEAAPPLRKAS